MITPRHLIKYYVNYTEDTVDFSLTGKEQPKDAEYCIEISGTYKRERLAILRNVFALNSFNYVSLGILNSLKELKVIFLEHFQIYFDFEVKKLDTGIFSFAIVITDFYVLRSS